MTVSDPIPAAQYLRKSTEHQKYSLEYQADLIKEYATQNNMVIVETYSDTETGMVLKRRKGLRKLLSDVIEGKPPYKVILVYDVTRWGRFLDADESAYYEFICKAAGIAVHYCAEPFPNDGTLVSFLMKSLKRLMAGEYSRELSAKVLEGTRRLAKQGFKNGSVPGFGLRRMLVSKDRQPKQLLEYGQLKNLQEDRVILTPGPEEEKECVRHIFQMFLDGKTFREIANELNRRGIQHPGLKRKEWYGVAVARLLRKPKYCGELVYGCTTQRLKIPRKRLPKDMWIRVPGAWEAIVSEQTFQKVQEKIESKGMFRSDAELLDQLRAFARINGGVKASLLTSSCGIPSSTVYLNRFGSFSEAVALAGLGEKGLAKTVTRRKTRVLRAKLMEEIVSLSSCRVSIVQRNWRTRPVMKLRNGILVSVYLCSFSNAVGKEPRWILRRALNDHDRITLVARLDATNQGFLDFYVIPRIPWGAFWTIKPDDQILKGGVQLKSPTEFESAVLEVRKRRLTSNP